MILCFILGGCQTSPKDKYWDSVTVEIKRLIDAESFSGKYVKVILMPGIESGSIYWVMSDQAPFFAFENTIPPYKVLNYKTKSICYFDPVLPDVLSRKELSRCLGCEITEEILYQYEIYVDSIWFHIGVKDNGERCSVVKSSTVINRFNNCHPYTFPQLLEFMFEDYNQDNVPRFILGFFGFYAEFVGEVEEVVDEEAIKNITGITNALIYCSNASDSAYIDHSQWMRSHYFATINRGDTLQYVITDAFDQYLWADTEPNSSFFSKLPSKKQISSLYQLMKDSTYLIDRVSGEKTRIPVFSGQTSFDVWKDRDRHTFHRSDLNDFAQEKRDIIDWLNQ